MKTLSLFPLLRVFVFSTTVVFPFSLAAQTTAARPDRGIMPGASYSVSDIENISLTNGNVQLTIPLASLPPIAGGKLKFTLNAVYNSKLWNITRQEARLGQFYGCPSWVIDTPQLSDLGGWRIPVGYQIVFRNAHDDFDYEMPAQPPAPDCETDVQEQARLQSQYYRAILITPDGAEHELRPTDNYATYGGTRSYLLNYYKDIPNTVGSPMRYYTFDGSYLYAVLKPSSQSTSWTVYMNDGTRVVQYSNGIQRITDTNGNSIKIFSDANGTHIQDEHTSREIRLHDNKVWYETVTGLDQSVDIVMGTTQVQGKIYQVNDWSPTGGETGGGFVCQRNDLLTTTVPVIREIVFPVTEPNVSPPRYSFSYNSDTTSTATDDWRLSCGMAPQPYTRTVSNGMGELSQVTTPTGAIIKYSYSKSSIHNFSMDVDEIPRATVTQKQVIHDGITDTWTYDITEFSGCGGVVTAPDGSVTTETCYPHDPAWAQFFGYANTLGGLVYRSSRSNKEVVERHWTTLPFSGANTGIAGNSGIATFNPVVDIEYLTLLDDTPNHSPIKMSARKFQYDFNGNLTQQIDYDWFNPSLVSRDSAGVPTGVPASATVLRTTNYAHYNQAAAASSANVYAKRSLTTVTPLILNAPQQTTLGPSIVQLSYDGQAYGVAPTAGNLTSKRVWDDLGNKWIATSSTYDVYGNVVTATDGRGHLTQYFFDDTTHALPTRVVVDPQNTTGTQTTTTVYDYATGLVTSVTDPNDATSTISYTNQLLGAIDPFGRPGVTSSPLVNAGGVNQHCRVTNTYEDHLRRVIVASDLNSENDKLLKTRTTVDMLGRPVLTEQTEDGTNYTLYTQQAYAQGGRISFASSAMRTGVVSNTDSWTRVTNDSLGRATEVATFGGATQPPNTGTTSTATGIVTTIYDANFTTVTDQAGKLRRSMVDAVGRLIRVDEPDSASNLGSTAAPVQPTNYAYDVFGNLTTVAQGSQTRTFTYDSVSRLRQAINPESSTVTYQYDDNGNLLVKTDARTVSTHFEYDALNRITRRWYNGSNAVSSTTHNSPSLPAGVGTTDEARFYYDAALTTSGAPGYSAGSTKGRLVAQTYGTGTNGDYYAYDALGRATLKIQQTGSVNYQLRAAYNLAGSISTLTYPSGHTVTNTFDQSGRLTALSGNLGDGANRTYATGILYAPTGGLVKEQFGTTTPIYNKLFYNSRGQLAEIRTSTSYTGPTDTNWNRGAIINNYSDQCTSVCTGSTMTDNNGNLKKQQIYIPNDDQISSYTMRSPQYEYDSLNRLNSVREVLNSTEQWRQWFKYDRWGNRTIDTTIENGQSRTYGTGINNKAFTVNTSNNRLGVPGGQSGVMTYDAAGNLTNDTYTGAGNRTYDAENKITSAWGGNNQAQLYSYDASGQRTKRTVDGVETWQVYGFGGELLAEYSVNGAAANPQKEYGYRNGALLVTVNGGSACDVGYQGAKCWTATYPSLGHATGQQEGSNWVAYAGTHSSSHMVYGPYDNTFGQGPHVAQFTLMVDNNSGSEVVATLDVVTGYGANVLASRQIRRNEFIAANQWQTFTLAFNDPNFGVVEARVWWTGNTNTKFSQLMIAPNPATGCGVGYQGAKNWTATHPSLGHATGQQEGGNWAAYVGTHSSSHMAYGPYDNTFGQGSHVAQFTLMVDNNSGSEVVATLDVVTGYGANVLASRQIRRNEFVAANQWQTFTVPFDNPCFGLVEARVWWTGNTNTKFSQLLIAAVNSLPSDIRWLVTDQLGTPRMIFDQSGSLANVKRHDYLPFGEELFAGGRNTAQGYASDDGVRQQFTAKERDVEIGLDYFGARYYASVQGRFTGADPYDINFERQETADPKEGNALFTAYIGQPQHWNHYSYALNNPLKYVDPDGLYEYEADLLGKKIKVHIDDSIINNKKDPDALKRIQGNLQKAFDKINAGAGKLTKEQIQSIGSMSRISVSNQHFLGMNGSTFQITQRTAENPNLDKLSADIIHDSRHREQSRRGLSYNETTAIPMEMEASQFAVDVMKSAGGWDAKVLQGYEADARTGHLPSGWKDKSTPQTREKVFSTMKKPRK